MIMLSRILLEILLLSAGGTLDMEHHYDDNVRKRAMLFDTVTPRRTADFHHLHERYTAANQKMENCSYINLNGYLKMQCFVEGVPGPFFKCSNSDIHYQITSSTCQLTSFNRICPNDTTFYQACGHDRADTCLQYRDPTQSSLASSANFTACGKVLCEQHTSYLELKYGVVTSRYTDSYEFVCLNGSAVEDESLICLNTILGKPVHQMVCEKEASRGQGVKKSDCNNICDYYGCEDEASCHNLTIGMWCYTLYNYQYRYSYISPYQICDTYNDCKSKKDEKGCELFAESCMAGTSELVIHYGHENISKPVRRALSPRAKCSVPGRNVQNMVCLDYRDQMNCTGSTISHLVCKVDGYPTTISDHVICKKIGQLSLCDDDIDNECVDVDLECRIHKHRLCDNIDDCRSGYDESDHFCKTLLPNSIKVITCVRRFSPSGSELHIPNWWILDGISDCRNNMDENENYWTKLCGFGSIDYKVFVYNGHNDDCYSVTQFKCPKGDGFLNLDRVCSANDMGNCDTKVCVTSRKNYLTIIHDKLIYERSMNRTKTTLFCLPGLTQLEKDAGKCSIIRLTHQTRVIGIPDLQVVTSKVFARGFINCRDVFGELYVHLACSGLCGEHIEYCPLQSAVTTICLNYPLENIKSLDDQDNVAVALAFKERQTNSIRYSKAIFSCENRRCITFDKVCNLKDDCGDFSDEVSCENNFKCQKSGEYIPLAKKCDRRFDCFDYSDECNTECNNRVTMFDHVAIKVIAWIFGIIATLLNTFTLVHGFWEYKMLKTEAAKVNKGFVLLISFGDLLQGIFLIILSIGEEFLNDSTCVTQHKWITNRVCSGLGVLSTIGSLVSLYSMTVLSVIRASKVRSMKQPKKGLSRKMACHLFAAISAIIVISLVIAVFPLVALEDYFVQNLVYDENPLLIGAPNKAEHLKILESYYGRILKNGGILKRSMSWRILRTLIKDLFNKEVIGSKISFYGSNGFCLFSYFVRGETSFRWYSLAILFTNFVCVAIIVACYIVITIFALRVSKSAVKNPQSEKNNRKLQRKTTVIIVTDVLTWLPFIIVCFINYTEFVDTSSWYSVFSVFFLPINSLINPLGIYDETVLTFVMKVFSRTKLRFLRVFNFCNIFTKSSNANGNQTDIEMNEMQGASGRKVTTKSTN